MSELRCMYIIWVTWRGSPLLIIKVCVCSQLLLACRHSEKLLLWDCHGKGFWKRLGANCHCYLNTLASKNSPRGNGDVERSPASRECWLNDSFNLFSTSVTPLFFAQSLNGSLWIKLERNAQTPQVPFADVSGYFLHSFCEFFFQRHFFGCFLEWLLKVVMSRVTRGIHCQRK